MTCAMRGPARAAVLLLACVAAASGVTISILAGSVHEAYAQQVLENPVPVATLEDGNLLNGTVAVDVFTIDGSTYAAIVSDSGDRLTIVDVTDPANPSVTGHLNDDANLLLGRASGVTVFETGGSTYAAVTSFAEDGLQIIDITTPASPTAVGNLPDTEGSHERLLESSRGVDTFETGGNTYAVVASRDDHGIEIIDVTTPASPASVGNLTDTGGLELEGAFAVDIFEAGNKFYAVVAAQHDNGIQIVDITDPTDPTAAGKLADSSATLLRTPEGVAVFETGGKIYAAVTSSNENGLQIVDISDPTDPTAAGKLEDATDLELDDPEGVDIFTVGTNIYAVVAADNDNGIQIVDITDPIDPTAAGRLQDDGGRKLSEANDVAVFEIEGITYAVVTSGNEVGIQLVRLTEVPDTTPPQLVSATLDMNGGALTLVFDEVIGISSVHPGDMSLLKPDGTQIVLRASTVETAADSDTIAIAVDQAELDQIGDEDTLRIFLREDSVADLSQNGISEVTSTLTVIPATETPDNTQQTLLENPVPVGSLPDNDTLLLNSSRALRIFTMGDSTYAVMASYGDGGGIQIIDVTNPTSPAAAGQLPDDGTLLLGQSFGVDIFMKDSRTYAAVVSGSEYGIQIIDVTNPTSPAAAGSFSDLPTMRTARSVAVFQTDDSKTYAAVTSQDNNRLQIIDVSDPDILSSVGGLGDSGELLLKGARGVDIFVIGSKTYAAVTSVFDGGLQLVDITTPDNPNAAGQLPDDGTLLLDNTLDVDIFVIGTKTYAAVTSSDDNGIQIVDVTDPASPAAAGQLADGSDLELDGAQGVDTFVIGDKTYAAVASSADGGLQIVDITDPENPSDAGKLGDSTELLLEYAIDVAVFEIGGSIYAAVTTATTDASPSPGGIQLVLLAPQQVLLDNPVHVEHLADTSELLLDQTISLDTFMIGNKTYAAVASSEDDGLQIVNVTDPANPDAAGNLPDDNTLVLDDARDADIFVIGDSTYAVVTSYAENNIQIVNVTNPDSLTGVGTLAANTLSGSAPNADIFVIGNSTYAAVTSFVGSLHLVNVTDPAIPEEVGSLADADDLLLGSAFAVDTFVVGDKTYATVTSITEHGIQIVDVTDPKNPDAAGNLADTDSLLLSNPGGVTVFVIGTKTYAAVTSSSEGGLQLVDVTDPENPDAAGNLADSSDLLLANTRGVDIFVIGDRTYAAVTSRGDDDGIQIVDVTNPDSPTDAGGLTGGDLTLEKANGVAVFNIGADTYAAVTDSGGGGLHLIRLAEEDTNRPPVAPATTATTATNTPVTITPEISDPDGDTPRISAVDDPPNGSATFTDTTVTYTPDQDYDGTDTFGYTVTDGTASAQGTITVTVSSGNHPPTIGPIRDRAATVGTQLDIVPTVTDADPTDTHTFSINRGTLPAAAVFTTSDGSLTWTPSQADVGTYTVTITVNDGRGGTDSATFDITVSATDTTLPLFVSATLDENTGAMMIVFDEALSLVDLSKMHVSDVGQANTTSLEGATEESAPNPSTISLTLTQAQLNQIIPMVTPQLDIGNEAVRDTNGNYIDPAIDNPITVTEATSNSPPVAPATTAMTAEDTPVTITPALSDPDGDTPQISAVDDPPNGSVTFDDTTVTYTPDQDYEGTDTFGYTVTDGTASAQGYNGRRRTRWHRL